MAQKRLLLLGGLRYLLPVIEEAHRMGIYVITADYLPNNIAHKYSDEYINVSIIDKEAVLEAAKALRIDGILSHAVDPGVVTAAFVAEQMGLPYQCSYEAACILQDKAEFRQFLRNNGFNCPFSKGYSDFQSALQDIGLYKLPIIVKPVDSAGSKGVSKVASIEALRPAIELALSESHCKRFIIEEFLEKSGFSAGSESFFINGKLVFNAFYDQMFDLEALNPYTPSAEIWPSSMSGIKLSEVKNELQRLSYLLGFRTGLFNIEFRLCSDGKLYLMEVSPRAGGNRLAEIIKYATDTDVISAEINKAVGIRIETMKEPQYNGSYAIQVLYSYTGGLFSELEISKSFEDKYVIEKELRVSYGDCIYPFNAANSSIGTLFLHFKDRTELEDVLAGINNYVHIVCQ